jgi:hypothetical protein
MQQQYHGGEIEGTMWRLCISAYGKPTGRCRSHHSDENLVPGNTCNQARVQASTLGTATVNRTRP